MQVFNNIVSSDFFLQDIVNDTHSVISPIFDCVRSVFDSFVTVIIDDQSVVSVRTVVFVATTIVTCTAAVSCLSKMRQNIKTNEEIKIFKREETEAERQKSEFESKFSSKLDILLGYKHFLSTNYYLNNGSASRTNKLTELLSDFNDLIINSKFKISINTDKLNEFVDLLSSIKYSFCTNSDESQVDRNNFLENLEVFLSLKDKNILISDEENMQTWDSLEEKYKDLCDIINPLNKTSNSKSARK